MDYIKQIKKDFHSNCKEMTKHFKNFNKNEEFDINLFLNLCTDYDYLHIEDQKELEKFVLDNTVFFKLINKCKNNILLIQHYKISEKFTKKELDYYNEMCDIINDLQFSKQFKVNLLKKRIIKNDNIEKTNSDI